MGQKPVELAPQFRESMRSRQDLVENVDEIGKSDTAVFGKNKKAEHVALDGKQADLEKGLFRGQRDVLLEFPISQNTGSLHKEAAPSSDSSNTASAAWDDPGDPQNPVNWSKGRKWQVVIIVALYTLVPSMASTMVAPMLTAISDDLHIGSHVEMQAIFSIFVMGYVVGPLFFEPLSEALGRWITLQIGNAVFALGSIACGFAPKGGLLILFRLLSGLGGSSSICVGADVINDCWKLGERSRPLTVLVLARLLGFTAGPIFAAFVTEISIEHASWRWVFWITCTLSVVLQVCCVSVLPETHAAVILRRRRSPASYLATSRYARFRIVGQNISRAKGQLSSAWKETWDLVSTLPIVSIMSVYMGYLYGLLYLMLSTLPILFTGCQHYRQPVDLASVNYVSIGLGCFIGSFVGIPFVDRSYFRFRSGSGKFKPRGKHLFVSFISWTFVIPVGLFVYGWTAETHQHWIIPNLGATVFSMGVIVTQQFCQSLLVEAIPRATVSTLRITVTLRSIFGFCFPLLGPALFNSLGFGWGNSLLAFVAIGVGFGAVGLIVWFGLGRGSLPDQSVNF